MAEATTIARPYAQAVFELAQANKKLGEWSTALQIMAEVAGSAQFLSLIGNPKVEQALLGDIVLGACKGKAPVEAAGLMGVLVENGRIALLPQIAQLFELLKAEAEKTVIAEVISAYEVSSAEKKEIAGALKSRLGREVELDCRVDESLLGGALIRAGDLVIDGSVTGRLSRLTNQLLH